MNLADHQANLGGKFAARRPTLADCECIALLKWYEMFSVLFSNSANYNLLTDLEVTSPAPKCFATRTPTPDPILLKGLARACYWQSLLDTGQAQSLADLVRGERLDQADVTHWMRLTLLAPDLLEQLLAGQRPNWLTWLTWRWLRQHRLPADLSAQRRLFNPALEENDHAPEILR